MFKRRVINFRQRGLLQKPLQPEESLQAAFVNVLELCKPKCVWFSIPNGGKRKLTVARILKLTGLRPGVFDMEFLLPGQRALFIEFKAGKNSMEPSQKEFEVYLKLYGFPYAICRSVEAALRFLLSQAVEFEYPERLGQFLQNPSVPPRVSESSGPGSLSSNKPGEVLSSSSAG